MNYYERIQKAVDYIENHIYHQINLDDIAKEAFMSLANLYRIFFALTGHTVKEYIRNRRLFLASQEILNRKGSILSIALRYNFNSHEAFTRAFKKVIGTTPSSFRKQQLSYKFERMNILDKYYDIQDQDLLEKYPEIKVLKQVEPFRVAYYCYFGKDPESQAWKVISQWLKKNKLDIEKDGLRVFGYNNPNSSDGQEEYGYEIAVTIADDVDVTDKNVKMKVLEGGLYAVANVKGGGEAIASAWKRFMEWIKDSKYVYGGHQWLEEHLGFDAELSHTGSIDIYMPIEHRGNNNFPITFADISPMRIAYYRTVGKNAIEEGRKYFLNWANTEGFFDHPNSHRFFAYYNHERSGCDDFWYEICVSVDKNYSVHDQNIKLKDFSGGHYAVMKTKYKRNGWSWGEFIQWVTANKDYSFGNWQFFEEYLIKQSKITPDTEMILHMPVQKK